MAKAIEHTTMRNGGLFCLNCGGSHALPMPMPVDGWVKKVEAFNDLHRDCEKTWEEPKADQSKSVRERMMHWLAHGHIGASSKSIFIVLSGDMATPTSGLAYPYDPDDFSRCYKLLEMIPEWKKEMHKMKPVSPVWSNLVDNWDKLTKMYEKKDKGMYEFMKSLGC